jgi:putative SOS response-associated peptidase YedK
MCYSVSQTKVVEELERHYGVEKLLGKEEPKENLNYFHANGFAHPLLWIIPQEERNRITPSMWGIMPGNKLGTDHVEYYKEAVRFGAGLNAQSEKLFDHFIYKYSAMARRCIVPVTGFFEPHTAPKKFKVPFYFERKNQQIMSIAGLYTITKDGYNTFTVLTKPATPLFAKIHNTKFRRPVILNDADIDVWLDSSLTESDIENVIDDDMPDELLSTYPISKDLYNPKIDSNREDITKPIEYSEVEIDY